MMDMTSLTILEPWDGDILTRHDGVETDEGLEIVLNGTATPGVPVTVNGVGASRWGGSFQAPVVLRDRETRVEVTAGDETEEITLLYVRNSRPRFRFSLDDNILFLRDIARGDYASLFDHWYLGFLREMHEEFGAKVHINIYYETQGFDLTQFPDRYRDEWQASADWLRLTFHARQNEPAWPYENATYDEMARDYELVTNEVRRFAGEELLSTFTTVHWARAPREACRALRDRGIQGLIGLFSWRSQEPPRTIYYLDDDTARHVVKRDAWMDTVEGLTFVVCDCVLNNYPLDGIVPHLEQVAESPHTSEMMELLIHEQYFREELPNYQPDARQKVRTALRWVTDRGYEPVFWGNGYLGLEG